MFIQIIQGRTSRPDEVRAQGDRWQRDLAPTAPGWLGGTYGFTDDGTFVAVVRFESRAKAAENADRPEQGEWWREMEALFDGPVAFHDSEDVTLMMDGGSDDAGFVQVVQGKVDDADALRALATDTQALHEARPEILGGTLVIGEDGSFTETIAFTSEDAAREAESSVTMPDDVRRTLEQAMHDVRYLDLHEPWFASRA